jgi:hypothetical protein
MAGYLNTRTPGLGIGTMGYVKQHMVRVASYLIEVLMSADGLPSLNWNSMGSYELAFLHHPNTGRSVKLPLAVRQANEERQPNNYRGLRPSCTTRSRINQCALAEWKLLHHS